MSTYTRDYTGRTVLEPPQLVLVRLPGMAKCSECGGEAVVRLDADSSGYGVGTDHLHARNCSEISCQHGKLHNEDCEACEAASEARRLEPLAIEAAVGALVELTYNDTMVKLDAKLLRQCLVDDVGATGTAMLSEAECQDFICGAEDEGEVPPDLKHRFPKTNAWLEEQLT
jgi:hypothetical protein